MDAPGGCSLPAACHCCELHIYIQGPGPQRLAGEPRSPLQIHVSGGPGPPPARHRSELRLHVGGPGPSPLSAKARSRLERHVQRLQQQRRWGLPRRVQESWRLLTGPALPSGTPRLPRLGLPATSTSASTAAACGQGRGAAPGAGWGPEHLAPELRAHLQSHAAKKCLELRLGAPPAPVRRSQQAAARRGRRRLARPIHAGHKRPQPRAGSLLFLPAAALHALDTNVRHKRLAFLWGLPHRYLQPWAAAIPAAPAWSARAPSGPVASGVPVAEALWLGAAQRAALERHVLRRRLQHTWGLPGAAQRSLRAFLPRAPRPAPPCPPAPGLPVQPTLHALPFLAPHVQSQLDAHIAHLLTQQHWGLPKRLGTAVRGFLASAPPAVARTVELPTGAMPAPAMPGRGRGRDRDRDRDRGLVSGDARERLESHVRSKQLQHAWGLPALVQGSLGAFAAPAPRPPAPALPRLPAPAPAAVHVPARRPAGLSAEAWQRLEAHVQRQAAERRWGLPRRVQESLRRLQPPGPAAPTLLLHDTPATAELGHEPEAPGGWCCCAEAGLPLPASEPEGASSQDASQPSSGDELLGPPGAFHQAPAPWAEKKPGPDRGPGGSSWLELPSGLSKTALGSCRCAPRQPVDVPCRLHCGPWPCLACPCCQLAGLGRACCRRAWELRASPCGASDGATADSGAAPGKLRDRLSAPRATSRWLDTHVAQRALGCFLLPPRVIESLSLFADAAAMQARGAARQSRAQLSQRLHGRAARKSKRGEPRPAGQPAPCPCGCQTEPWALGPVKRAPDPAPPRRACCHLCETGCGPCAACEKKPSAPAQRQELHGAGTAPLQGPPAPEVPGTSRGVTNIFWSFLTRLTPWSTAAGRRGQGEG